MSTYTVWGWGGPADEPDAHALAALQPLVAEHLGFTVQAPERPAPLPELAPRRVEPPTSLSPMVSAEPLDRAAHSLGRSYSDILRGIRGDVAHAPDLVLRPRDEADVVSALDWASGAGVAVIPFGGGTSVVGGVTSDLGDMPVVSLDLGRLAGVAEVDRTSRAARILGGTSGPVLESQLKPHGLTLRFYPQSFERSTFGGWLATRAAGHFATRWQHIDDLVESVRAVTPAGIWQSRRLPGSGAGPSPDRALLGSEGVLGVITEGWARLQERPTHRASTTLGVDGFERGCEVVRALVQSGVEIATCRLVDARESAVTGTLSTGQAALVLGAESAHRPVDDDLEAAVGICLDSGAVRLERASSGQAAASWGESFKAAPRLREQLILLGVLAETFETATTWDQLPSLVRDVTEAVETALADVCGGGRVTCRLTHVYPDGAAPYFTVLAPARRGSELAQWAEIKAAASDALLGAGGTITHHHAVGRDHRPWYDNQRPEPFAVALTAAKAALDPAGILNPGVLLPSR